MFLLFFDIYGLKNIYDNYLFITSMVSRDVTKRIRQRLQ